MKLLLADDEPDMIRALNAILTHEGDKVDAVYDGAEALEKAAAVSYDGLILDIMMPKLDGLAVLSGICFGIYHMNWVQGVYASCLGVVLAFVYERTRSILGAVLFHMFFNCSSYLLELLGDVLPDGVLGLVYLIAMAVSVVAFIPLLRKVARLFPVPKKKLQKREETSMIQEEEDDENV